MVKLSREFSLESYNIKTKKTNADPIAENIVDDIKGFDNDSGLFDGEIDFLEARLPVFTDDETMRDDYDKLRMRQGVRGKDLVAYLKHITEHYQKVLDKQTNNQFALNPDQRMTNIKIYTMSYSLYQHFRIYQNSDVVYYLLEW